MTKFTKDGKALAKEQCIALRIFHGIYGYYYKPEYEEANELDRELIENPDFIKDLFSVVYGLQSPCGEILLRRMSMMSYDDIADELGISSAKARSYENQAWRNLRHPKRSKLLKHYTEDFEKLREKEV